MVEGSRPRIGNVRRLAVLRRAPCAAEWAELTAPDPGTRLFLHGDAVVLAEPERLAAVPAPIEIELCASSWDRRCSTEPDARVVRGSLATLYAALGVADEVRCIGCGGSSGWRRTDPSDDSWLLEIAFAPADSRQARETLEFVLGAAALELDARVLFRGPGYNHLLTEAARGWAQLTDFDLLELLGEVPDELVLPLPVRRLEGEAIEALVRSGRRRLAL